MTKSKSTKKALLASAVSLILCFSMLLGTTYAWFTDSVTSANNKIVAGTLDVDLYLWKSATDSTEITNESEPIFGSETSVAAKNNAADTLWEPGKTQVVYLSIKNNGNLDLKYKVALNVVNPDGGKDLYKVMKYDIIEDATYGSVSAWNATDAKSVVLGTNATQANDVELKAGAEHKFALAVHMDESAGNEYQGGKVNFDLTVFATQLASEEDSFNNQYDKDAIFYDKLVTTDAELKAAVLDPDVKTIAISGKLTYDWGDVTNGATALKGITLVGYNGTDDSITFKGLGSDNDIPNVTLKNITVSDSTESAFENSWEHTYLEFNTLTANNVVFKSGILLKGNSKLTDCSVNSNANEYGVWILDGNATLNNCTFTDARGVKIHEQYATNGRDNNVETVVIDGCVFNGLTEKPGVALGTLNNDTAVSIKNSTFINCQAGKQGLYIYETDTDVTTIKFTNENNTVVKPVDTAADLADALAAGNSVILTDDITMDAGTFTVAAGTKAVINLDGNDLTVTDTDGATPAFLMVEGDLTITGEGNVAVRQINASEGSKLTISEGVEISASGFSAINNSGTLVINGATINHDNTTANGNAIQNQNGGTLIINNATVTSNSTKNVHTINNDSGTVTVNGGTFTHNGPWGNVIHQGYDGEIIINGGTFTQNGNDSLVRAEWGGKVTINAGEFKNNVGGVSGYVPATSTATTNADGSITVTVNN